MRRRVPSHDGLWMDREGDTWVVDVCAKTAILIHDGCSYVTCEPPELIDDILVYAPFETICIPKLDDRPVFRKIRREQDMRAARARKATEKEKE